MEPIVRKLKNFWCLSGKHDKVYRLELQEFNGQCDVIGAFARRARALNVFIVSSGTGIYEAEDVFDKKVVELIKKGYVPVNEDVSQTSELTFKQGAWS